MTELPQATSRRELRDREAAAAAKRTRANRTHPAGTPRRSAGRKLLSVAAMLFVGALAVGLSIPANAFAPMSSASADTAPGSVAIRTTGQTAMGQTATGQTATGQTATVSDDEASAAVTRDDYQVLSWSQVLAAQYAQTGTYTYAGGKGSIRWPFIGQAPISSPYGPRTPLCAGCTSSFHNGTDFLPGVGAPIFAIANGVVTDHTEGVTDLGNNVTITHKIGKDTVTSTYGHMQTGSSPLVVGQTIHVGDFVGLVGQTGEATGPHLHLGITVDGIGTDPIPWMEAHVN